jgi:hypothetical protein
LDKKEALAPNKILSEIIIHKKEAMPGAEEEIF